MDNTLCNFFLFIYILSANPLYAQERDQSDSFPPSFSAEVEQASSRQLEKQIDQAFGSYIVAPIRSCFFYDLYFWDNQEEDNREIPFIVLWLILGASFFTIYMRFINVRAFKHAVSIVTGKYDQADDPGEVTHFRALASALSATVGLGNIAGVAIAVSTGGPGAVFWMVIAGFLGMSSKFVECTLGQLYRRINKDGRVAGGPMLYLAEGLRELGYERLGKIFATLFALLCIGGSFGAGNMFQSNQSFELVRSAIPFLEDKGWFYGLFMAVLVGIVIIGGIRRIGTVAGYIVPIMCGMYTLASVYILLVHRAQLPFALFQIVDQAFTPEAQFGGFVGVLITGFRRAAFSNEAGVGSASIAHSAAATKEPVREGIVALLEPFIDTIVVCSMTGLVVVITGTYNSQYGNGAAITSAAYASVLPWFPNVLALSVFLFAFSTMISWSYYGERCWSSLFGIKTSMVYRIIYLVFTFFGPILQLNNVLDFSDLMILGMAFPNIFGAIFLSKKVRKELDVYWTRYKNKETHQS